MKACYRIGSLMFKISHFISIVPETTVFLSLWLVLANVSYNWQFESITLCHLLLALVSFQTHMTFIFPWNTKGNVLKNLYTTLSYIMNAYAFI